MHLATLSRELILWPLIRFVSHTELRNLDQNFFYCESSQIEFTKTIESSAWWRIGLLKR